jgi:drug/metabolite transporter (DMT)-like permease
MSPMTVLVLAAAVASATLLLTHTQRVAAGVALLASGLQILMIYDILQIHSKALPLPLILGAALLIAGGFVWAKSSARTAVTASTVIALVGALQVLLAAGALR